MSRDVINSKALEMACFRPGCTITKTTLRSSNTLYAAGEDRATRFLANFVGPLCEECGREMDEYYADLWASYYSDRL
jgi:hypothetical protein